jgi:diacylglycerol kinase
MITRYLKRFPHALRGLLFALRHDFGFRTQVYGLGVVVAIAFFILLPLSPTELLFVCLAYFLILITELQNSALEIALDRLHPELNDAIGKSKDLAAGAVLLAGFFLLAVLSTLTYAHLLS